MKNNIDKDFIKYAKNIIMIFYEHLDIIDFETLTNDKILKLKELAPNLLEEEFVTKSKFVNYIKKMKRLNRTPEKYNITNDAEKYVLFMFSVDPTFEAIKIYEECNHIADTIEKMKSYFGIYDNNLIKIEKNFIKYFLSQEEKYKFNEEINKRIFS